MGYTNVTVDIRKLFKTSNNRNIGKGSFDDYYRVDIELFDDNNVDEVIIKFYLSELLRHLKNTLKFKQKVDIDDLDFQKGWKTIYNLLFEGFTYQIISRTDSKRGYIDSYLDVDITSDSIKISEDKGFKKGFNYSQERLNVVNKIFQESIDYIRKNDLFLNKLVSRRKQMYKTYYLSKFFDN